MRWMAGHAVTFVDSGLTVMAKPLALKRAIGNLFDNALFYGERVEISVRQVRQRCLPSRNGAPGNRATSRTTSDDDGEADNVEIQIRDHGPGVPEQAFSTLFQPYQRLAHGRDLNAGGMGLGLGIARNIVQAHGGELRLENHVEGGLVATIILPQS